MKDASSYVFLPQTTPVTRLLMGVLVLLYYVVGLFLVFDTTSAESLDIYDGVLRERALLKQILFGVFACAMGFLSFFLGYRKLLSYATPLYLVVICLLLLVWVPGIGQGGGGAKRWISIAGITLQPSELVKIILPLFCISQYLKIPQKTIDLKRFLKLVFSCVIPIFLILLQPNNGTCAILLASLMMLYFILGIPLKYFALPMAILALIGGVFAYNLPYVRNRVHVYLHPESDLQGRGHQPYQAKIAAGSGQLFGKGPGKSLQKFSYLPEAQNDYIAAIFAEEFGFLGTALMVIGYALLTYLGYHTALMAKEESGMYIAAALTFLMTLQAFLNLGVVSSLLPTTGVNLPFVSQGGSSLLSNACMIGILLSI
jgi:cell division protein FtsW